MTTFTDEKFNSYEFRCTTEDANVGFKHVCRVYDTRDNLEIANAKAVINWGNRTWESYQYQSVYEQSKQKLSDILSGSKRPEFDTEFLYNLANGGYIYDYGELEDGELVVVFDGWYEKEGRKEYNDETHEWEVKEKSVWAKLEELSEKGLLKPSVKYTIDNIECVFTDEYAKCDDCQKYYNTQWGELTWVEELDMYLCDNCINSEDSVSALIEDAKENFKQALKPTIKDSIIEDLGYSKVTDEEFSFARDTWGETRWGCINVSQDQVEDFCQRHGGFVKIACVEQFDCPFYIYVPDEELEDAQADLKMWVGDN